MYYPTGKRNYVRIVAADDFQGAADAQLAKQLGAEERLHPQRQGDLRPGRRHELPATRLTQLGIEVAGFTAGTATRRRYESLATKIKQSGADGVFLGGIVCENGGKLIKDLRAVLGTTFTIHAPTASRRSPPSSTARATPSEGAYISFAGHAERERSARPARRSSTDFTQRQTAARSDPYSAYAAQAAQVLLTAIANSDGTRADVATRSCSSTRSRTASSATSRSTRTATRTRTRSRST